MESTSEGIEIQISESNIVIHAPIEYKEVCQSLPGSQFTPHARMWRFPKTYHSALKINRAFRNYGAEKSPEFQLYLLDARASRQYSYMGVKMTPLAQLPEIPIRRTDPWEHQAQAFWFAYHREAVMLDMDMGTGKTKVVYDLIMNRGHKRVIVTAPIKILESRLWDLQAHTHWAEEAGPLELLTLDTGTVAQRVVAAREFYARKGNATRIILINTEAIWRDEFKHFIKNHWFDLAVAEESHRLKAAGGKAAMAMDMIGKRSTYRICMSGTPMAHSPLDIYAQYRFLDAGIFGTNHNRFLSKYALFGGYQNRQVVAIQNEKKLYAQYYKIAYRVEDVVQDLPKRQDLDFKVDLDPSARLLYERLTKDNVAEFKGHEVTVGNSLTMMLRQQQITGGTLTMDNGENVRVSESKKEALRELLTDIRHDEPIVVYARFLPDLDTIKGVCDEIGADYAEISGRENAYEQWGKSKKRLVLGVQISAGSLGIDLTKARYAIYYSLSTSLSDYRQSRKRIHRPGQTRPTMFIHILARSTVDILIKYALKNRMDVIQYIKTVGDAKAQRREIALRESAG